MSNEQLYIPKTIRVGYQERSGTYNGLLAYIIYIDDKGKVRKEGSWESWRHKQVYTKYDWKNNKNVQKEVTRKVDVTPKDFDNVPTEGFVLNKKAGGGSDGWNHRNTYCRVYDPRGFEFEISIPNLLFILQESSCMKGKGLEGEFVYSWDGKDLVLLPASSNEYKKSSEFTELQSQKVSAKELVAGVSYLTKNEDNLIYLGRFNWYEGKWNRAYSNKKVSLKKKHIFVKEEKPEYGDYYIALDSMTTIAKPNTTSAVTNYATLMDEFSETKHSSKPIGLSVESANLKLGPDKDSYRYSSRGDYVGVHYLKNDNDTYTAYEIEKVWNNSSSYRYDYKVKGFYLKPTDLLSIKNGEVKITKPTAKTTIDYAQSNGENKLYTRNEITQMGFLDVTAKLENNKTLKLIEK